MIRAEIGAGGVVLVADVPRGSLAYVDRDWLPAASGGVPAVVVGEDGRIEWHDGTAVERWEGADPGSAAALALLAVAREAATIVKGLARVEVSGGGLVAMRVRALVEEQGGSAGADPPRAIVETTGAPAAILDATRRVADLGTVVLAGESPGGTTDLNLYPDVHVRGLALVGVAPPLHGPRTSATESGDAALVEWCRQLLGEISSGSVVPEDAAWFCVTA